MTKAEDRILYGLVFGIILCAVAITIYENRHPWICTEHSKVAAILELRYRDAILQLDNGKTFTINQASLKVGDMVCTKYER